VKEEKQISLIALRHCAARLVAAAVCRLSPHVRLIRGEATDNGFFYDFELQPVFTKEAFPMIEEHLRALLMEKTPIRSHTMMTENAQELFRHRNQPLKSDVLEGYGQLVNLIQIGDFYDECPEPYPESLQELKNLQLLDVKNIVIDGIEVIRLFGTVFHESRDLKKFLKKYQKELGRKVSRSTQLIEKVSDGEEFLEAKVLGRIEDFRQYWIKHCLEEGIAQISSPTLQRRCFLNQCGFDGVGEGEWVLPTTCAPAHFEYMALKKELRVGEFCRLAQSLEDHQLAGLFRSRCLWSDQVHIMCDPTKLLSELISSLHFLNKSLKMLSIEGQWFLNSYGRRNKRTFERWDLALKSLYEAWEQSDLSSFPLNEGDGGGLDPVAFVGPRIECHLVDSLGRRWQGPYVGIWVQAPTSEKPIIERSLFGSVERLIGHMLERVEFEN